MHQFGVSIALNLGAWSCMGPFGCIFTSLQHDSWWASALQGFRSYSVSWGGGEDEGGKQSARQAKLISALAGRSKSAVEAAQAGLAKHSPQSGQSKLKHSRCRQAATLQARRTAH
ncbi:hypothetical protein HaLaN_09774 [Haematococcus lacustris]|uniref:Uncharacterized protein n=1 Tax=Haematococcus lacustris TaxID=44745 RepID=A0A699ZE70_HAELA|nr:hypothetical protein HaLaN_09774 [Haematococcus lacustris]